MSEEEKKIIETVENFIKYYKKNEQTGNRTNLDVLREECNAIEFILNKYDIQQKELKQEKEKNKELEMQNKEFLLRLKADGLIERDKYWTNKIKKALYDGILEAKGWGCEDGAYLVQKEFENLIKEIN
jgi:hypothetical protein